MSEIEAGDAKVPLTPYQRRLFVFLSVATFFEGYDFIALTQILPNLRADMALDKAEGGLMVSFITAGTVLAFFLVRAADRLGRRKLLTLTIAGYTVFTFASGLAPEAISFAFFQFLARMFLVARLTASEERTEHILVALALAREPVECREFLFGSGVQRINLAV